MPPSTKPTKKRCLKVGRFVRHHMSCIFCDFGRGESQDLKKSRPQTTFKASKYNHYDHLILPALEKIISTGWQGDV